MATSCRRHIRTTVGHFYGRVSSWDVVNEALSYDGSGAMCDTVFLRKLGAGYVDDCFRVAHQVGVVWIREGSVLPDGTPGVLYKSVQPSPRVFVKCGAPNAWEFDASTGICCCLHMWS